MYCQDNVWADTDLSVESVNRTLSSAVGDTEHFDLFLDLTVQLADVLKKSVAECQAIA